MLEELYKNTKAKMQKTVELLGQEFTRIRTSRANPAILDGVKVAYYGSTVPLKQIASISIPEPKQIIIQPWDRTAISEIEKAIYKADLGLTPQVETNLIRIPIPALTEERRNELVKLCAKLAEDSKIAIRNIRRETNDRIKKMEKDKEISEDDSKKGTKKVQEFTDEYIKNIDDLFARKEKEILEK
ncbi:MAG: ribosome recycling factor [candidate division WOR-3 bacterium]|nr:ribosome recycling factor [candidate division WOR-3 bacterium]MDH5683291.1 ribosome recycling factor [candidate division WOR-3 bacterium]